MLRSIAAAGFALGMLVPAVSAHALEMVAGGFGDDPSSFFVPPSAGLHSQFVAGSYGTAIGIGEVTPRYAALQMTSSEGHDLSLDFSFGVDTGWLDRLQRPLSTGATDGLYGAGSMLVGGGLILDDIGLMGGFGRTRVFGSTTDMVAAGLSIGPLRARVAYGQTGGADTQGNELRDVMMFSTDLAAWSWLTLEGDLAVATVAEDRDQAVGRLGVRLEF